jgi:hypothetical protein
MSVEKCNESALSALLWGKRLRILTLLASMAMATATAASAKRSGS